MAARSAVPESPPNRLCASAAIGAVTWVVAVGLFWTRWTELLVLLGVLVVLPLSYALAAHREPDGTWATPWKVLPFVQLPAAMLALLSFAVPVGYLGAGLSLPWVIVGFLGARMGLLNLVRRGRAPFDALALDIGLIYSVVGTIWLACSRAGTEVLGFGEPTVLLTAAHFHFAGLALPVLTGLAARRQPDRLAHVAVWGVVVGMPLVAVAITIRQHRPALGFIEMLCVAGFTSACVLAALVQLRAAWTLRTRPAGWLLMLSSGCLLAGMTLALVFALGIALDQRWLDIPTMVVTHAMLNALGFTLPALLAWHLERTAARVSTVAQGGPTITNGAQ